MIDVRLANNYEDFNLSQVDKPDREVLLARGFSLLDKKSDSPQRNRDLLSFQVSSKNTFFALLIFYLLL